MFEKLKAMFGRKKAEQPKEERRIGGNPRPTYALLLCPPRAPTPVGRATATETKRDDSNDLLNPLNPISPLWHGNRSASTNDCGSSSSSYDSDSSRSCDSGSSW